MYQKSILPYTLFPTCLTQAYSPLEHSRQTDKVLHPLFPKFFSLSVQGPTRRRHGFILCGTQSTKKTPTWYKTYAIVGVVSIPTYKKCYAGVIFEFPENNEASQKSSLPCLDLLSYLLSDFGIFLDIASSTSLLFFEEKNECPDRRAVFA
jgi:hypothetical protein